MAETGTVLRLVGSPSRGGRIYRMVAAALDGAARTGARVEPFQVPDHVVGACTDCLPWECQDTLKCVYPDPALDSSAFSGAPTAGRSRVNTRRRKRRGPSGSNVAPAAS